MVIKGKGYLQPDKLTETQLPFESVMVIVFTDCGRQHFLITVPSKLPLHQKVGEPVLVSGPAKNAPLESNPLMV